MGDAHAGGMFGTPNLFMPVPQHLSSIAAAPPIQAYHGIRAAEPGRTIDRRNASAERARAGATSRTGITSRPNNARIRTQTLALAPAGTAASVNIEDRPTAGTAKTFCVCFVPHMVSSVALVPH